MKIAWIFPGQGAQAAGMGRDVAGASPAAREVFARVDAVMNEPLGLSLSRLCFEGPDEQLTLTENVQPALVATEAALLAALRERHPGLPAPSVLAGHSLGEYAALVAGGALDVVDACRVVHRRGRAMQQAVPAGAGAMSAVIGMEAQLVEELCAQAAAESGEPVSPANYNGPGQIVIAGTVAGVSRAEALVKERKGRAITLKVSAPFHCALMAPAALAVRGALREVDLRPAAIPVVSNVDAVLRSDAASLGEALVRQVDAPVRWQASVEAMLAQGVTHFLEIGPGKVLAGLVKRIAKDAKTHSCNDLASLDATAEFLA